MTVPAIEQIAHALVELLETIKDQDKRQAAKAARIIRRDLSLPTADDRENNLALSLSGKGIHDWSWSKENTAKLKEITDPYWITYLKEKSDV